MGKDNSNQIIIYIYIYICVYTYIFQKGMVSCIRKGLDDMRAYRRAQTYNRETEKASKKESKTIRRTFLNEVLVGIFWEMNTAKAVLE